MENSTRLEADNRFSILPHWIIFSGISAGAIHLYAVLAKYASYESGQAWPSRATLAKDLNKSRDSVDRYTKELLAINALRLSNRYRADSKENMTNLYTLVTAKPLENDGAATVRPPSRTHAAENDTHLTTPNPFTREQVHAETFTSEQSSDSESPANTLSHTQRLIARAHIMAIAQHINTGGSFWDDRAQDTWASFQGHLEDCMADQGWPDFDHLDTWTISGTPSTNYEAGIELNKILHALNQ